jgi:hypothetical protein
MEMEQSRRKMCYVINESMQLVHNMVEKNNHGLTTQQ